MMIPNGKRVDLMFRLEPFQKQALDAVEAGRDVLVIAPTGAGKTRIADEIARRLLPAGRRVVYASPLKAISAQKYRQYAGEFGEENVGILTGDVRRNPEAPLAIMTTEIFRNRLILGGERPAVVVLDEFQMIASDRGDAWEESIIFAPPETRIVALSATVRKDDAEIIRDWMAGVRETDVELIISTKRPVPLETVWSNGVDLLRNQRSILKNIRRLEAEYLRGDEEYEEFLGTGW